MNENRARNFLLGIWASSFLTCLVIAFYLHMSGEAIEENNFNALVARLNGLYVTYLGVMISFYLTRRRVTARAAATQTAKSNVPFVIAASGSFLWNAVILSFVGSLLFGVGYVEDTITQVETFGSLLSWLVAPAIGFYFGKLGS